MRAGIYLRISDDPTGQRAGVQRQLEDCQALAEARGWDVAEVYEDNDLSAYSGQQRPAYGRLLDDLKAGVVDAVIVWHLDRLHRHPKELEDFFEVCDAAGVRHLASVTGDVDLATDDGRFHARILGAVARKESDDKSRRIRRKAEELARAGKVGGGGTRPFGYEADRVTVRPDEGALIREAADRIVRGDTLYSVVKQWDAAGVQTPAGNAWRTSPLRRMLLSPRIAGRRQHRGEDFAEAEWPAIIDIETHERLKATLARSRHRGPSRRYLLTGIARCGLCEAKLVARPKADGRRCYVCASGPDFGGCGKIRQLAEPFEEHVAAAIFEALDTPALLDAIAAEADDGELGELLDQLRHDELTLKQLSRDHYVDRKINRAAFFAAQEPIEGRIAATQRRIAAIGSRPVAADVPSGREAVRAAWEAGDLTWRRALVSTVVEVVVLHPAIKGRNFFDAGRVEIRWRA